MSNGKRTTGLFGVAGVLVAVLIISGFVIGGNISQVQGKGMLTVRVMDKPVELLNLWITVDWAKIQGSEEDWVELTLKEPFYIDLLTLQNVSETLSETEIAAGNYSMIQIHVLDAKAVFPDDEDEDTNPQEVPLTVPSDVIKVSLKPHLEMKDGGQVTVLIDLQPDDQNTIAVSKSLNLRPVIKAVVG